jgi:Fe-S oxidoreductase
VHERLSSDIPRLVKVARRELRAKFLGAQIGISGANVAVAETGSLVIVTNEGNARLVATLPHTHIAIVGIEKLVERFDDVVPILTALPRSATGQLLTSYVSILTGAVPNTDGSAKDLHIILMDNRRSEMARDPRFRQALQCIRCASCLNVCPVYRLVGGHVFGKVYTGGIGTILTAWFDALKNSDDLQSLCIQCGNCAEVCPGKINIPELILELRRRLAVESGVPPMQKAAFAVVNNRRAFHAMLRAASVAQKPFARQGYIRHLPLFLSDLTGFRSLPAIAKEPFRDRFRRIEQPETGERVAFYAGCLVDFAYTEIGTAVVKVLNRAGLRVVFPEGQTCCGAPARYSGAYEVAARNACDNIEALESEDVRWIVLACPTCTVALKHEFAKTLESVGRADWLPRAEALAAKVIDFSTLVKRLLDEGRLAFAPGAAAGPLTYHDSCHLKRTLHADREPRELLAGAGFEIREMAEPDVCCGMGGSYSLKLPEISAPMLERKLRNAEATGAPLVAMDCPGCLMQIRGGFDKRGSATRVEHTAVLLARLLGD